jgi:hypothetical protein
LAPLDNAPMTTALKSPVEQALTTTCFLSAMVLSLGSLRAAEQAALPAAVDLWPAFTQWGLEPSRQGARPTCSVFVVAGALEFAVAKRQGRGTRLSVEFLNWAANDVCGEKEDGGFFSDLWKGFAAHGICAASNLPYRAKFEPSQAPPAEALAEAKTRLGLGLRFNWIKEWNVHTGLTEAHVEGIKRALDRGWPVCGGLRWPKREEWIEDVLQMCPSNAVRDGHSVLLVGYRDEPGQPGGGVFIFRNTSRGGRDGFMPYAYARAYMNDAAWVDYKARAGDAASSPKPSASLSEPPARAGCIPAFRWPWRGAPLIGGLGKTAQARWSRPRCAG